MLPLHKIMTARCVPAFIDLICVKMIMLGVYLELLLPEAPSERACQCRQKNQ